MCVCVFMCGVNCGQLVRQHRDSKKDQAEEVWAGEGKARAAHLESPLPCSGQGRKLPIAALDSSELLMVLLAMELSWGVVHPVKV